MFDNDILVYNTILIRDALEKLDKTAEKVLLVVDSDKRLVGTLTDGDIRRHILKGAELSDNIKSVYQTDPIFVSQDEFNSEMIKKTFIENKVELIPVLDQDHRVVDFITWDIAFGDIERTEKENLKVPVVIMAGGKGERLEPFTRILPKLLIPVGNKPVVEHIIDKFREHGINEFYLTINHMSKIVRAYFEEKNPDYSLIFVEESEPRGTAGSLKLLADKFKKPFFVSNCDIIIEANYADLYQFHVENKHDITLVASAKQFNIPYGICELNDDGSLESLCEKPKYNFLVNTGLYILDPKVIELIPDHELFHITQLIDKIKERKGSIGVYPVSEKAWVDVGQWEEYKKSIEKMQIFK